MATTPIQRADFYVYVLFRPDTGAPFYVGKGLGDRWRKHLNVDRAGDSNRHKKSIIKKAQDAGLEIPCVKVRENLTEPEAFETERALIATLGRAQFGGILTNLTDGGDGESGKSYTPETLEKMRQAKLGKKLSEEHKAKIGAASRGRKIGPMSLETRQKLSAARKGHGPSRAHIEMLADKCRGKPGRKQSEETKAKLREARKRQAPMSAEARAKISAAGNGRPHVYAGHTQDGLARIAASARGRRHTPESRAKIKAAWVLRKAKKLAIKPTEN
jgi:hypothetical protein